MKFLILGSHFNKVDFILNGYVNIFISTYKHEETVIHQVNYRIVYLRNISSYLLFI